jgi:TctA family transporter
MNPGPTIFLNSPENVYALFFVFIHAYLLMVPLGWALIKASAKILKVPRNLLMPVILIFSILGSYAIKNSLFDIWVMLGFGVLAFFMEENDIPLAPAILGLVLGPMIEENFMNSIIMANGDFRGLIDRPIAAVLAGVTLMVVLWPLLSALRGRRQPA